MWTEEKLEEAATEFMSNVSYCCPTFRYPEAQAQIKNAFLVGCNYIIKNTQKE